MYNGVDVEVERVRALKWTLVNKENPLVQSDRIWNNDWTGLTQHILLGSFKSLNHVITKDHFVYDFKNMTMIHSIQSLFKISKQD